MNDLETALFDAHAAGDARQLMTLYADASAQAQDAGRAAFYLTHAYVFALEVGDPRADTLHAELVAMGREAPLPPATAPYR